MQKAERMERLKAIYFLILTFMEVFIGICFIIGSILFFSPVYAYYGTWLFLIGSIMMIIKPLVKFVREIHYYRIANYEEILDRK